MTAVFANQSLGRRGNQEDGFRVERQSDTDPDCDVLMLLADGMGGHAGGEVASALALDTFLEDFLTAGGSPRPRERLHAALRRANAAIGERVARSPELAGMGCTLIGCLKIGDRLVWVSVGDSVLFRFRQTGLARLNADHSVYGEMRALVAQGRLSQAEADSHPNRHALRSAVVGGDLPMVDLNHAPLEPGDIVILASDGLETLSDETIERIVRQEPGRDPEAIVSSLLAAVDRADRSNQDNTTVVVFRHDEAGAPAGADTGETRAVSRWTLPAAVPATVPDTVPAAGTSRLERLAGRSGALIGGVVAAIACLVLVLAYLLPGAPPAPEPAGPPPDPAVTQDVRVPQSPEPPEQRAQPAPPSSPAPPQQGAPASGKEADAAPGSGSTGKAAGPEKPADGSGAAPAPAAPAAPPASQPQGTEPGPPETVPEPPAGGAAPPPATAGTGSPPRDR